MIKSFSSAEIATICNVTPRTVIRWISTGRLLAFKLSGRGNNRVAYTELLSFLEDNGFPIPSSLLQYEEKQCLIFSKDKYFIRNLTRLVRNANFISQTIKTESEAQPAIAQTRPDMVIVDASALKKSVNSTINLIRPAVGKRTSIILFNGDNSKDIMASNEFQYKQAGNALYQNSYLQLPKPVDFHLFSNILENL